VTVRVSVRLTEEDLAALDAIVATGRFATRSDALRAGCARVVHEARQHEIDAAYRRGYDEKPQEEWVGAFGLSALAAFGRAEGDESL
jgi:Arc/MetJ-type ribon-helix-helix transcriptional regulator